MAAVKAVWSAGAPTVSKDPLTNTLTASVPLKNSGVLAATVSFSITEDRVLVINVFNEPGSDGLAGFQAWSNT